MNAVSDNMREITSSSSRFLWSSSIVVLMMLPLAAHGELEINAAGWAFVGDNRVNVDVVWTYPGSRESIEGHFQPGFGLGLVYWFVGAPFLGVGMEYLSSKVACGNTTTDFWDVHCCLLVRIQFGQNSAFPHGSIVPYLGIGYVGFQNLSGDVNVLSQAGYKNEGLDLWSAQLELKAGLECMILGWMGIFIEGRIMTEDMEGSEEISSYALREELADIPMAQLTIGIALHIGR